MLKTVYSALVLCALPFALWRAKQRAASVGKSIPFREYFGKIKLPPVPSPNPSRPRIWLHAVSVGEAAAAETFVRELQSRRPNYDFVLTHTTAAGGQFLRDRFGNSAVVAACPLDFPPAVSAFIRRVRPVLAVVMEAEYWPNLLAAADDSGAKILLANARMGRANARRYARVAPLARETVGRFAAVAAQTRADARRLRFFGAKNIVVSGNLKFDRDPDPAQVSAGLRRRELLRAAGVSKPIVLFASVRPGEGEALIRAADDNFFRDHFCVIAPRHPERSEEIATELKRRGLNYSSRCSNILNARPDAPAAGRGIPPLQRRVESADAGASESCVPTPERRDEYLTDVWLADSLGEMASHYAMSDAAIIGGGFGPAGNGRAAAGGQNPIEAMSQGVAAVSGPDATNYAELVSAGERTGAMLRAKDATDAIRMCRELCRDEPARKLQGEKARALCESRRGALRILLETAEGLLDESESESVNPL